MKDEGKFFLRTYIFEQLNADEIASLTRRVADDSMDDLAVVREIIENVKRNGDEALRLYTEKYDGVSLKSFAVSSREFDEAEDRVSAEVKEALSVAAGNIETFHKMQIPHAVEIETSPGVVCRREWRPVGRVGLYVPGGTAPLVSTVLMLGIPARLAGCSEIVLCTPPLKSGRVSPEILYAARLACISRVFKLGGVQAIAGMAFGTGTVSRADKIFGPGNRFVALAKSLVSQPPHIVAIDTVAGPSELLIVADESANPRWVAADLLTQAEHGPDSQVVLVTSCRSLVESVNHEVSVQLAKLPREAITNKALEHSFSLIVPDLNRAIEFANLYAPEHLMLVIQDPHAFVPRVQNAGSVFIGSWSSVVFGDYASGTNHTLPTGGTARAAGGICVESFMKPVLFQTLTQKGFSSLAKTVKILARQEGLEAHAGAVAIREKDNADPTMSKAGVSSRHVPSVGIKEFTSTDCIRPHLKKFKPYSSARSEATEGKIFLDANESALGSPFAFEDVALNRYPDPTQKELRKKLAQVLEVSSEALFVGVGSDEVIDLLLRLYCEPWRDNIVVLEPTYGVYRVAAESHAVGVVGVELDDVFQIDVHNTLNSISGNTKIVFCCSPNNPTGNLLRRDTILQLCKAFRGIVVVDEAYVEFSEARSFVGDTAFVKNLVVLRTLSKAWGLAGIRLGYCVTNPGIISYLMRIKAPYNINAVTSRIALNSLDDSRFFETSRNTVIGERRRLSVKLEMLRSVERVYPSDANFLLVRFNHAEDVFSALLKQGIVVRRRSEDRLKGCLRITIGTPEENDLLMQALSEVG